MWLIIETKDNAVLGALVAPRKEIAIETAIGLAEEDGMDPGEANDALRAAGFYEDGDYRVTLFEVVDP